MDSREVHGWHALCIKKPGLAKTGRDPGSRVQIIETTPKIRDQPFLG